MKFRTYDPAIGRFNGIDPVTHFSQGTSVAFDNNPIYWADPSGADASGADGLTNNQWLQLSRPGGGGHDAMRAQARQNFQNEVAARKKISVGEGSFEFGDAGSEGRVLNAGATLNKQCCGPADLVKINTLYTNYIIQGHSPENAIKLALAEYGVDAIGNIAMVADFFLGGPTGEGLAVKGGLKLALGAFARKMANEGGKKIFVKGLGKVSARAFHQLKPSILNSAGRGSFTKIVGKNPDIFVKNGKIFLKGVGERYKGKVYETALKAKDFFK